MAFLLINFRRVQLTLLSITTSLQDSCDLLVFSMSSQLVQYVIVRGDLLRLLSWPTGAVIAQACHASTAVLWTYRNDPHTIEYTSELDHMHKVVLEVRHATNVAFCSQMMVIRVNLHYSQGRSSIPPPPPQDCVDEFIMRRLNLLVFVDFSFISALLHT